MHNDGRADHAPELLVMTRPAPGRRRGLPRNRNGLTIIEVIVAMMVLTFGLLGMAGVSMTMTKQF